MSPPGDPPLDPALPSRRTKGSGPTGNASTGDPIPRVGASGRRPRDVGPDIGGEGSPGVPDETGLPRGGLDDDLILQEIDRLREELGSRSTAQGRSSSPAELPEWDESGVSSGPEEVDWAASSPYLEERLRVARTLASRLAQEAGNVERGMQGLRTALETMDQELGRASDELDFVRNEAWSEPGPGSRPATVPVPRPSAGSSSATDGRAGASTSLVPTSRPLPPNATGSFQDFTVARYNRTVEELHARRRATLWVVLVLAAAISAALLFLTLKAHEPVPAVWLAVLPLVWMIPVPFFVVAFRGTHRVLREHRLELPEEP